MQWVLSIRQHPFRLLITLLLVHPGSSEEVLDKNGIGEEPNVGACGRERSQQQRSNTTVHVCWHRNTSISTRDHLLALEVSCLLFPNGWPRIIDQSLWIFQNQLSGYLLRKFKNSNGWQKLWVVFTNFCLFFYKTFQVSLQAFKSILNSAFQTSICSK